MSLVEINFDGIVGPSHNYAGLSMGNRASMGSAGKLSHPRAAALQGIEKMRANLSLGLHQGILLPHQRPNHGWMAAMGQPSEPHLQAAALSASASWAANAATVSPAPDTADGRCHLTAANLLTMSHRAHEWPETLAQLRVAFADDSFAVHGPVPVPFGDEGAANHMRLAVQHDAPGVEVFVYGTGSGAFPARQRVEASRAVARRHGVERALFVEQSPEAIAAGAFHNDVVAVANEHVLLAHEQAFVDKDDLYGALTTMLPEIELIEVPSALVSLDEAISTYLFNAQLVTLPNEEGMALILPTEAREHPATWHWLSKLVAGNGSIRRLIPVDVKESMANGGGPACLRLRVVADPSKIDPRFLVDEVQLDAIAKIVFKHWPETIEPASLFDHRLVKDIEIARSSLLDMLGIAL